MAYLTFDGSVTSIVGYACIALILFAMHKGFEHWKWEHSRPTLSVTRPSREQALLNSVLQKAKKHDPQSVLDAVDAHCRSSARNWMMNVGDVKGKILDAELQKALAARKHDGQPFTILELGTYTGYASVRMARFLRPLEVAGGGGGVPASAPSAASDRVVTVEMNEASARIAQQIIRHAGVQDRVTIIVGDAAEVIPQLQRTYGVAKRLDFVFIDHWKELYLPHFRLLQATGLLAAGTVVVADNVIYPGAPEYLAYVRAQPTLKSVFHDTFLEYTEERDGVEVSTVL